MVFVSGARRPDGLDRLNLVSTYTTNEGRPDRQLQPLFLNFFLSAGYSMTFAARRVEGRDGIERKPVSVVQLIFNEENFNVKGAFLYPFPSMNQC